MIRRQTNLCGSKPDPSWIILWHDTLTTGFCCGYDRNACPFSGFSNG
jgi:hypothetical protein